jgi:hypothetical protein
MLKAIAVSVARESGWRAASESGFVCTRRTAR